MTHEIPPVVLVVFNRPEKTRLVLEKIVEANPPILFVIADGPRATHEKDFPLVTETRQIVEEMTSKLKVVKIYSNTNLGLRNRFMTGLDEVFSSVSDAIILEDDCLPSASFFRFSQEVLRKYSHSKVALASGSNHAPKYRDPNGYFFSSAPYIWGWATWASTWKEFRASEQKESWTEEEIAAIRMGFHVRGQAREFESQMRKASQLNTWDISFAVWVRQNQLLTAVPNQNLVRNIGFGEGATHTIFENFDVDVPAAEVIFPLKPPELMENDVRREKIMWWTKRSRWLTFPARHPIEFLRRIILFLRRRPSLA